MIDRPGIWIPASIWNDDRLSLIAKILLSEILYFGEKESSFYKTNEQIAGEMQISSSSVQRAVKELVDLGLIESSFNGRRRHLFGTPQIEEAASSKRGGSIVKKKRQHRQIEEAASSKRGGLIEKKEEKKKKQKEEEEIPFPFEDFGEIWNEWKDYKKAEHRFTFKSPKTELTSLKQLQTLANHDRETARQIIGRSIANGWKGFFPLPAGKGAKDAPSEKDRDLFESFIRTGKIQHDRGDGMEGGNESSNRSPV